MINTTKLRKAVLSASMARGLVSIAVLLLIWELGRRYRLPFLGAVPAPSEVLGSLDRIIGDGRGIQGNLDPTRLLGPLERTLSGAADVLERAAGRPGHIFNLGHGILPSTPLEHVQALARYVHGHRFRR